MGLDSRLSNLLRVSGGRPTVAEVEQATPRDLPGILSAYKSTDDLLTQRGLLWTLSYHGHGAAEQPFESTLRREFKGPISREEENVMHDHILAIGLLAENSASAFEFLRSAVDPKFWEQNGKWQSPRGEHSIAMCVSYSIHALGASGRAETPQLLEDLRQRDRRYLHQFAGDITQAAFYLHLRQTRGPAAFKRGFLGGAVDCDHDNSFDQWIAGAGNAWFDWANDCMLGPRPPKTGN
ncbi:MAG: hypothetical protein ACKVX7_18850 [Planctomycetota bacterium]